MGAEAVSDNWMKALGTSKDPLQDDWQRARRGLFLRAVTFATKPSLRTGDRVVLYATGKGLVFAAGDVISIPYEEDGDSRWGWRVRVSLTHGTTYIHDGVPLERIEEERILRNTIKRRSHIRLTDGEFEKALELLPEMR
jgi:hypothetical protein